MAWSDGIAGAIGDVAGSLIGGGLSFMGAQSANSANIQAAREQMAFQERMANTQYQRAVKDLQAAGLNPMMAYGNIHTSSPSGALPAAIQSTTAQAGQQVGNAVGKGIESAMKIAQIHNIEEQNRQIRANTAQSVAATEREHSQTELNRSNILKIDQDILTQAYSQALLSSQAKNTTALTGKIGAETGLLRFQMPGAEAEANMYSRPGGQAIPYGKALLPAVSSAVGGATIGSLLGGKIKFGRKSSAPSAPSGVFYGQGTK